jgi:L,D-transpeptidase YcbB
LHDTKHQSSSQSLFDKENRFFSHGCMRLSKPMDLANLILEKPMFTDDFMETCLLEAKTKLVPLKSKIPVFIIYQTQQIDENGILHQYKNPYKLKF